MSADGTRGGRLARAAALAGAWCAAAGLAAGCGGVRPADLFVVTRSGPAPGQSVTLLVDEEGGVRCNGGRVHRLSDPQLVQARAIEEELHGPATSGLRLPARPGSLIGYTVREDAGSVSFADNSQGRPKVLSQLSLFVQQVAAQVCAPAGQSPG